MSSFDGVVVSDPWLQNQFTQFISTRSQSGQVTMEDLPPIMAKLKALRQKFTEEIRGILGESYPITTDEIDFEAFLRAYLNLQARATAKSGDSKNSSAFLKATTTTLLYTISEPEKSSYVAHINSYLGENPFLKKYLLLDAETNDLFELEKVGVLSWCVFKGNL